MKRNKRCDKYFEEPCTIIYTEKNKLLKYCFQDYRSYDYHEQIEHKNGRIIYHYIITNKYKDVTLLNLIPNNLFISKLYNIFTK